MRQLSVQALLVAVAYSSLHADAILPDNAEIQARLKSHWDAQPAESNDFPCLAPECKKPSKKHERMMRTQPGIQWMDHGGYCGSWSIQRAVMAKGAWISQQQVRNHTVPGGGHDEEILATNIDLALKNLKLKAEGFDYKHLPTPQANAYRQWIKEKLVAGHAVVWMIMLQGGHFPVYPGLEPYGQYSHVEPVVGILSDHPLNDTKLYDDDFIVHYTDADTHSYYRSMKSLPDDTSMQGNCATSDYAGYPCIYEKYGFGWAIEGFLDDRAGPPLSLAVSPSSSEPDTRTGSRPVPLMGTVTVEDLTPGKSYTIFRWDSVDSAFDYSRAREVHKFEASGSQEVFADPTSFLSSGTTYYRCLPASDASIVV
eukprot:TRINITY_DN29330_c0_g1_i1.p1 TRINITY_DN29330_c0_g1~~TRINITY_DN29330_c0_g1_i1.p1  ORF type:complete len:368 (-),score=43.75 TRINITY_DN29330_c0_g1_i1:257-1360(-)